MILISKDSNCSSLAQVTIVKHNQLFVRMEIQILGPRPSVYIYSDIFHSAFFWAWPRDQNARSFLEKHTWEIYVL